ncbi:MAG: hypothetical protein AB1782_17015, partial [Cyanobacteriota bacterium]
MKHHNNNKYKFLFFLLVFSISFNGAMAQEGNLLDPLELYKPDTSKFSKIKKNIKRAVITSVSTDSTTKSIIIQGMPEFTYSTLPDNKNIIIEIPNSYLHPTIAGSYYNWNAKIRNSLPGVYQASVTPSKNKKNV